MKLKYIFFAERIIELSDNPKEKKERKKKASYG